MCLQCDECYIQMEMNEILSSLPEGHYHPKGLCYLSRLVSRTRGLKGDYIEIGCLSGRSSIVIGLEAKKSNAQLSCIDIWDSGEWVAIAKEIGEGASKYPKRPENISNVFRDNVEKFGLQGTITPIMDRSENVLKRWTKPLRFVHIDGCHEYEFVKRDTEWKRHLMVGGIICFHDYLEAWPGVQRAVDESFDNDERFSRDETIASLIAFRKTTI